MTITKTPLFGLFLPRFTRNNNPISGKKTARQAIFLHPCAHFWLFSGLSFVVWKLSSRATGFWETVHDDDLITSAMCTILDRMEGRMWDGGAVWTTP
jgi:hypothetical protein